MSASESLADQSKKVQEPTAKPVHRPQLQTYSGPRLLPGKGASSEH